MYGIGKSSSQALAAGPSSYSSDLPMPHAADLCTNADRLRSIRRRSPRVMACANAQDELGGQLQTVPQWSISWLVSDPPETPIKRWSGSGHRRCRPTDVGGGEEQLPCVTRATSRPRPCFRRASSNTIEIIDPNRPAQNHSQHSLHNKPTTHSASPWIGRCPPPMQNCSSACRRGCRTMVSLRQKDECFSDENIMLLQQLTLAGITAAARMSLLGVLNEHFINAQNLAKQEEQKRIARENDFA